MKYLWYLIQNPHAYIFHMLFSLINTLDNSYFEAVTYSSISKPPFSCGKYESFFGFRMSLGFLDLEQMEFLYPIFDRFKTTPPFS